MQRKAIKLQMEGGKRKISFCSVKKCENFNFIVIYVHMPMDALFCGNRLKLSLRLKWLRISKSILSRFTPNLFPIGTVAVINGTASWSSGHLCGEAEQCSVISLVQKIGMKLFLHLTRNFIKLNLAGGKRLNFYLNFASQEWNLIIQNAQKTIVTERKKTFFPGTCSLCRYIAQEVSTHFQAKCYFFGLVATVETMYTQCRIAQVVFFL